MRCLEVSSQRRSNKTGVSPAGFRQCQRQALHVGCLPDSATGRRPQPCLSDCMCLRVLHWIYVVRDVPSRPQTLRLLPPLNPHPEIPSGLESGHRHFEVSKRWQIPRGGWWDSRPHGGAVPIEPQAGLHPVLLEPKFPIPFLDPAHGSQR